MGQYYLRARYFDESTGRFVSQDAFDGFMTDPRSLHDYAYAGLDPVNSIDPSGYMSLQEAMQVVGQVAAGALRVVVTNARVFGRTYVGAAMKYGVRAIKHELKRCAKSPKECRLFVPIIFVGRDFPNQMKHIEDAQEWGGESYGGRHITGVLHYQLGSINRGSWPKKKFPSGFSFSTGTPLGLPSCRPSDKKKVAANLGTSSLDCDEYPFNASREGGFKNYKKGRVSARFIPSGENVAFGLWVNKAVKNLKAGDMYLVVPNMTPITFVVFSR